MFVLQQNEVAKKLKGVDLANYIYTASGATKEEIDYLLEMFPAIQAMYGAPRVAATVSAMTDHSLVYVYTGSETGYTYGNWYYWDASLTTPAWVSGGIYNSNTILIDDTLSNEGEAADAKATGDALSELNSEIDNLDADDIAYDPTETYTNGTVGAELFSQSEQIAEDEAALKSGAEADAEWHLGFYLDENGDLCQVEEEE